MDDAAPARQAGGRARKVPPVAPPDATPQAEASASVAGGVGRSGVESFIRQVAPFLLRRYATPSRAFSPRTLRPKTAQDQSAVQRLKLRAASTIGGAIAATTMFSTFTSAESILPTPLAGACAGIVQGAVAAPASSYIRAVKRSEPLRVQIILRDACALSVVECAGLSSFFTVYAVAREQLSQHGASEKWSIVGAGTSAALAYLVATKPLLHGCKRARAQGNGVIHLKEALRSSFIGWKTIHWIGKRTPFIVLPHVIGMLLYEELIRRKPQGGEHAGK